METARFSLILAEVETGIVLDADGERCVGTSPYRPTFATREAAEAAIAVLLQRFPFAEVWLKDGASEARPVRFKDNVGFAKYFDAMTAWRKWAYSSWRRWFAREPPNPRDVSKS